MNIQHARCQMVYNSDDEYDTRALPSNEFIKIYLEFGKPQEALNNNNRVNYHQYLLFKSVCAKIMLTASKLHVSIIKCRQILKTMIVENEEIFKDYGLALHHTTTVKFVSRSGNGTCRQLYFYPSKAVRGFPDLQLLPIPWTSSLSHVAPHNLEVILFGHTPRINRKQGILSLLFSSGIDYDLLREKSPGMTETEWLVSAYVDMISHKLRMLLKSLLMEEDKAMENVLELFKHSCAQTIAEHAFETAFESIRLYAACILECTLSSGTYYLMKLASKCKKCEDCRLISKSHDILYRRVSRLASIEKAHEHAKVAYEVALKTSPLASIDDISLLSHDCDSLFEKFKATLVRPKGTPFVSYLHISNQALKCGDIRDILKAATMLASYRSLTDGGVPTDFFVGTTFYHPLSEISKFHEGAHRYPVGSVKFERDVKRAVLLAGDTDLITLRVNETIFIFAIDRQRADVVDQVSRGLLASDMVMDGKEMTDLLKDIQIEGGSATYSEDQFGALKNAKFTGDQKLWIPPLAEDLLQAGVYISRSRENDNELGVFNVIERVALMEGKFSIRRQKKGVYVRKATRITADIYQCSDEYTKLTSWIATDVRIG